MIAKIISLLLWGLYCMGVALGLAAETWEHSYPQWQQLHRGLGFAEVQVWLEGEEVETLTVVKVDPQHNAFRVFHQAPQNIIRWQQQIQAPVIFNASYYNPRGEPCGLVLSDGQPFGPLHNRQMRGMFVAEPKGMSPDLPRATILDLASGPVNLKQLPWTQGVQSYPLLLDYKGRIRVHATDKKAHRTVIAIDRNGYILVFNTHKAYFTLHAFARFLKASAFGIDSALNLDGGSEAQVYIKTKETEYFSPPSLRTPVYNFLEHQHFWLTTIVGVFPRPQ